MNVIAVEKTFGMNPAYVVLSYDPNAIAEIVLAAADPAESPDPAAITMIAAQNGLCVAKLNRGQYERATEFWAISRIEPAGVREFLAVMKGSPTTVEPLPPVDNAPPLEDNQAKPLEFETPNGMVETLPERIVGRSFIPNVFNVWIEDTPEIPS